MILLVLYYYAKRRTKNDEVKQRQKKEDDLILRFFFCIPASAADATAVNPKGIKTLLANGLITFFISGNPVFSNEPRSLPRNPPDCIILDIRVFDNLISVDDFSVKALRGFETCRLVNKNL